MPDWTDVLLFRLLAEELSFTRAAVRAGISQPWFSQRIRRLERRVGTPLFDRDSHHVALTPAGTTLLVGVQEMVAVWVEAWVGVRRQAVVGGAGLVGSSSAGPDGGGLRLGLFEVHPGRLMRYLERSPTGPPAWIHPLETAEEALGTLAQGQVDAVFGYFFDASAAPRPGSGVVVSTAVRERLHAAISARHRLAARPDLALADLAGEPWLVRSEPQLRAQHLALLRRAGLRPRVGHATSAVDMMRALIGSGQAVGLASPLFRVPPGVVLRPLTDPVESVFLLLHSRRLPDAVVEALLATVRCWYVDGLGELGSPWLAHVDTPEAHPTLQAALAAARRAHRLGRTDERTADGSPGTVAAG